MLESKDYKCIDTVVLFIAVYEHRVTGDKKERRLMEINRLYFELFGGLCSDRSMSGNSDERIAWLLKKLNEFKT